MTNPFALIARADFSGIAAQTYEVWRQLQPERTLVVDLSRGGHTTRGETNPGLYLTGEHHGKVRITADGYPTEEEASWLVADPAIRSVFTVEVLYGDANRWALAMWGGRVVVQANPELFHADTFSDCDLLVAAPTPWEKHRLEGPPLVDLPVPVVLHEPRPVVPRGRPRFYHPSGAAMLDRNGTRFVAAALRHTSNPMELIITNHGSSRSLGRRGVVVTQPPTGATYEDVWAQADPDVLVIPRRYGGLSLPMNEAAARGIPIIATDLAPQNGWLPAESLVPASKERDHPMKGGEFPIWSADALRLATTIDAFCDPEVRAKNAEQVYSHAETLAWDRWRDVYLTLLCP